SRVSKACGDYPTVASRMDAIRRRASHAGRLAAAQRSVSEARRNALERRHQLAAELEVRGFASATEAEDALLPELDRNDLRHHVEQHRRDSAQVDSSLQAPHLAAIGDAVAAPTDDLEAATEAAEEAVRALTLAQGALTHTIKASQAALNDMRTAIAELARIQHEAGPVVRMAELANAQQGNQLRMTLPTFVLLQRFEEVVDLANVRLSAMTDGRYELRRTDAREGRSQKLGLGLEVIDHASGDATREPHTLSGGETFKASLAMALGLADAVTAEAGGVELNTLFVDEGFGSLDPGSLDAVMDQMTKLRQAGRTVGVISHVAEMKQRIAERVTVRPNGDGTSRLSCTVSEEVAMTG
ncbi:MAG: SMC family ATPase, partial [Brooklawnia sp.]|nr:SMC family ATPase [Brooklawnia sp.]